MTSRWKAAEQNSLARVVVVSEMADAFYSVLDSHFKGTASSGWSEFHFFFKFQV